MFRLIQDPAVVIPRTPMKDNDLWDEEAEAIVRFLRVLQ
jgi:hypothetical protein